MTDAEYREQKARIEALTKKWATPLGLRWWKVTVQYSREPLKSSTDGGFQCVAQAEVKWEYLIATLSFDLQCAANQTDEELQDTFVHECCHVLVNEMRMWAAPEMEPDKHDEAMKHEERVVSQLAKAFIWTMEAGIDAGKKLVSKASKRRRKLK